MKNKIIYGNWVPKRLLYFIVCIIILILMGSLFIQDLLIKTILWMISSIFFIALLYFFYLYHQFAKNDNEFQKKCWNLVIEKLEWDGSGKALDIGTGAGSLAIQLAKQFPSSRIKGIDNWGKNWDYSKHQCENNAKIEGVADRVDFSKASALNLPFDDREFDVLVSNFVFHEVRDTRNKSEVFKEALRVLKKGGKFSIQDTFLNTKKYGKIEDLMKTIKNWGVQEIRFVKTVEEILMPSFLKKEMNKAGLLFGVK